MNITRKYVMLYGSQKQHKLHTGNQQETMATPKAKRDIQREGRKYGNLEKFNFRNIIIL